MAMAEHPIVLGGTCPTPFDNKGFKGGIGFHH